jgi:hypothetical protein
MKRISVSLLQSQWEEAAKEAIKEKCSVADIVRRAIDVWIRDKNEKNRHL